MTNTTITVRTNTELKADAQKVLAELGMDMSTAINVFLRQVVRRQAIPFEISQAPVNTVTLGGWEGKIKLSEDFNEPLADFQEYME